MATVNEYQLRLDREGNRALASYLQAIFHELSEINKKLPKKVEEVKK